MSTEDKAHYVDLIITKSEDYERVTQLLKKEGINYWETAPRVAES